MKRATLATLSALIFLSVAGCVRQMELQWSSDVIEFAEMNTLAVSAMDSDEITNAGAAEYVTASVKADVYLDEMRLAANEAQWQRFVAARESYLHWRNKMVLAYANGRAAQTNEDSDTEMETP